MRLDLGNFKSHHFPGEGPWIYKLQDSHSDCLISKVLTEIYYKCNSMPTHFFLLLLLLRQLFHSYYFGSHDDCIATRVGDDKIAMLTDSD